MAIDFSTDTGKVRLRVGDFLDVQNLPDEVYTQALAETVNPDGTNNLQRASLLCAQYILASLAFGVHQRLQLIEIYGAEAFVNYKQFLIMLTANPSFGGFAPIPYGIGCDELNPILEFQRDWTLNYANGTQSQDLKLTALGSYNQIDGAYF